MSRIMVVLLGIAALTARPIAASAQTDTTRRRDTTRTPTQDTTRRVQLEARGETDLGRSSVRFGVGRANYGFSSGQALELQQALTRAGCDVGKADGVIGQRTLRGIQCFRDQQNLVVPGATVTLTGTENTFSRTVTTAADGGFELAGTWTEGGSNWALRSRREGSHSNPHRATPADPPSCRADS